jgi:NitT/TauT family transport system permease protein
MSRHKTTVITAQIVLVVAVLGVWELAASQAWVDPTLYGQPSQIWHALLDYYGNGDGWAQTAATAKAVGVALLIGVPAGIACGLLLASVRWLDDVVGGFLVPLNSMPRIALVPLFIIWFGLTLTTKVAVAVSIIFFMVLFNARAGVKGIDPDLLKLGRQLGLSRRQSMLKIVLPGSVPTIFAGVRLAVTYAILGVIASEMVAARDGLGLDVVRFSQTLQINGVCAIILVLAVAGALIGIALARTERWLLRWQ